MSRSTPPTIADLLPARDDDILHPGAGVDRLVLDHIRDRVDALGGPTSGADPMVAGTGVLARQHNVPLKLHNVLGLCIVHVCAGLGARGGVGLGR